MVIPVVVAFDILGIAAANGPLGGCDILVLVELDAVLLMSKKGPQLMSEPQD